MIKWITSEEYVWVFRFQDRYRWGSRRAITSPPVCLFPSPRMVSVSRPRIPCCSTGYKDSSSRWVRLSSSRQQPLSCTQPNSSFTVSITQHIALPLQWCVKLDFSTKVINFFLDCLRLCVTNEMIQKFIGPEIIGLAFAFGSNPLQ